MPLLFFPTRKCLIFPDEETQGEILLGRRVLQTIWWTEVRVGENMFYIFFTKIVLFLVGTSSMVRFLSPRWCQWMPMDGPFKSSNPCPKNAFKKSCCRVWLPEFLEKTTRRFRKTCEAFIPGKEKMWRCLFKRFVQLRKFQQNSAQNNQPMDGIQFHKFPPDCRGRETWGGCFPASHFTVCPSGASQFFTSDFLGRESDPAGFVQPTGFVGGCMSRFLGEEEGRDHQEFLGPPMDENFKIQNLDWLNSVCVVASFISPQWPKIHPWRGKPGLHGYHPKLRRWDDIDKQFSTNSTLLGSWAK